MCARSIDSLEQVHSREQPQVPEAKDSGLRSNVVRKSLWRTLFPCVVLPFVCIVAFITTFVVQRAIADWNEAVEACNSATQSFNGSAEQEVEILTVAESIPSFLPLITTGTVHEITLITSFDVDNDYEIEFDGGLIQFHPASFGDDLIARTMDGQVVILIEQGQSSPSNVFICDALTASVLLRFQAEESTNAVAFDPQGDTFALNEGRGTIRIFDSANYTEIAMLDVRDGKLGQLTYELAFHPSENLIAFALVNDDEDDYSIRIWDTERLEQVAILEENTSRVTGLAFNEDGTLLASSGIDGLIHMWGIEPVS